MQYPTNTDTTKNIWRVLGYYNSVDGIKVVSNQASTTTESNISSSLTSFYNTLEKQEDYVLETNKFNCTNTTCTTSNYSNIGLLSTSEYNMLGGVNSYLASNESYFGLDNTTIKNITSSGITDTTTSTTSGLRPAVYLQNDVKVTGSGTSSDPYRLSDKGDVIFASATLNGTALETFPKESDPYIPKTVTCTNGSIGQWNTEKQKIELTTVNLPTSCVVDFTEGYTVTLNATNGTVTAPTSKVIGRTGTATFTVTPISGAVYESDTCNGTYSNNTYTLTNINSNKACTITFKVLPTLYAKLLADKTTRPDRGSFSSVLTTNNTKTLYTSTENGTTVYYFAGNATDNWVKFGGYYWRIIRTNADGGIRLLYHGTSTTATDAYIVEISTFNGSYNNIAYVSYMYGSTGSIPNARTNQTNPSTIKGVIDTWYRDNLNTNYGKYISTTAVYCNDRSNPAGGYNTGKTSFNYGARTRLDTNKTPTYDCTDTNDKFTVDTSTGNGKLTYPIALMTADEVSFAGGLYANYNANAWYFRNAKEGTLTTSSSSTDASYSSTGSTYWWLLSPFYWFGSSARASVFYVGGSSLPGFLGDYFVDGTRGVRPVISLKADVLYKSGDGSAESPYEILETPDTISDVVKANAVNENGYRYEGSDPNNYIQMQKSDGTTEMWRIIGLFPDGENGEEVIRVRKVGYESAAYDSNSTNHWPKTTLYTTLSSTYTLANYKNTVNYKMYLGGSNNLYNYTSANLYDMERMLNSKGAAGKTSSTSYNSATTYVGSVGLMYPSDYGYAVLASDCARTINPSNYSGTSACYTNNWLYQGSSDIQWLISPKPSLANIACIVHGSGYVLNFNSTAVVTNSGSFSPVMALKSDVVVTGSGTQTDPYIMK